MKQLFGKNITKKSRRNFLKSRELNVKIERTTTTKIIINSDFYFILIFFSRSLSLDLLNNLKYLFIIIIIIYIYI
jgi:hypothetical protein